MVESVHNSGLRRLSLPQGAYLTERYRETSNSKASLSNIERQKELVLNSESSEGKASQARKISFD